MPISLQPNGVKIWYFNLRHFDLTELIVWNIKGLQHRVAQIKRFENQSLLQKLSYFPKLYIYTYILPTHCNIKCNIQVWFITASIKLHISEPEKKLVLCIMVYIPNKTICSSLQNSDKLFWFHFLAFAFIFVFVSVFTFVCCCMQPKIGLSAKKWFPEDKTMTLHKHVISEFIRMYLEIFKKKKLNYFELF